MSEILNLNNSNFDETVKNTKLPIIIDFWAEWCGPCKMIAPVLEEISDEMDGKLIVAKVDLDENQELSLKFSIRSIPTILLFQNGELKDTKVGLCSKKDLLSWIENNS